jgi:hypothetical protein
MIEIISESKNLRKFLLDYYTQKAHLIISDKDFVLDYLTEFTTNWCPSVMFY